MARTDTLGHFLTDVADAIRTKKGITSRLPSEYQEVEYIGASGTQYINTGILTSGEMYFDIEYELTSVTQFATIIGTDPTNTSQRIGFGLVENSRPQVNYIFAGNFFTMINNSNAGVNIKSRALYESGLLTITNGENTITQAVSGTSMTASATYPIYLFALNRRGSVTDNASARIYSAKIYAGTTLVGEFVPCYRKNDNVIGMYDLTTSTFFTNSGSGTFTKGNATGDKIPANTFDTEIASIPTGGGVNEVVSYTGSGTNSFFNINWQELVIPDTLTYVGYLFNNTRYFNPPKVKFNSNVTNIEYMYAGSYTTEADLSDCDITNVNSFYYIFSGSKITNIIWPSKHCTASNVNCKSMFMSVSSITNFDISGLYIDDMKNIDYMFYGCTNLTSVDMRNIKNTTAPTTPYMFYNCTNLAHIDMRGMSMVGGGGTYMMKNVPTTCEIIVKDATEKTWWNTNFPSYTNVKTAEEYDAE